MLALDSTLVLESMMELVGDLQCTEPDCPTTTKGVFWDLEEDQLCPAVYDDGTICAATVRVACDPLHTHK